MIGGSVLKHFQSNLDACTEGPLDQRMLLTLPMHLYTNFELMQELLRPLTKRGNWISHFKLRTTLDDYCCSK